MLSVLPHHPGLLLVAAGAISDAGEVVSKFSTACWCSAKGILVAVSEFSCVQLCSCSTGSVFCSLWAIVITLAEVSSWWFECAPCLAPLQTRALYLHCSSLVSKAVHVFWLNWRSLKPNILVVSSKKSKSKLWCMRSFAKPCQWAMVKSSFIIAVLCSSSNKPSKTGIAHWKKQL